MPADAPDAANAFPRANVRHDDLSGFGDDTLPAGGRPDGEDLFDLDFPEAGQVRYPRARSAADAARALYAACHMPEPDVIVAEDAEGFRLAAEAFDPTPRGGLLAAVAGYLTGSAAFGGDGGRAALRAALLEGAGGWFDLSAGRGTGPASGPTPPGMLDSLSSALAASGGCPGPVAETRSRGTFRDSCLVISGRPPAVLPDPGSPAGRLHGCFRIRPGKGAADTGGLPIVLRRAHELAAACDDSLLMADIALVLPAGNGRPGMAGPVPPGDLAALPERLRARVTGLLGPGGDDVAALARDSLSWGKPADRAGVHALVGHGRFVAALGLSPVSTDGAGSLYRIGSGASADCYVMAAGGMDGEGGRLWIPVPRWAATAEEGVRAARGVAGT